MLRYLSISLLLASCVDAVQPPETPVVSTGPAQDLSGVIDPALCIPDPGSTVSIVGGQISLLGACNIPLDITVGAAVPPITGSVRDNAGLDGNAVTMMLVSYVGANATVIDSATSSGDGSLQQLALSPAHIAATGELLRLRFYAWAPGHVPTRMSGIGAACVGCATPLTLDLPMSPPTHYYSRTAGLPDFPPIGTSISGNLPGSANALVSYVALPSGTVLESVRARVQEGTSNGSTRALVNLLRFDSATATWHAIALSSMSTGNGTVQTITANAQHTIRADSTYAAVVNHGLGSAPVNIYRLFVEYRPN